MSVGNFTLSDFKTEIKFSVSKSRGPGGQNVNKVSTKVELRFNVVESNLLTENEKLIILEKLKNKITKENELLIVCQKHRSQSENKEDAIVKFLNLIEKTLLPEIERVPTKPSLSAVNKRKESKRLQAEKKELRKKIL